MTTANNFGGFIQ